MIFITKSEGNHHVVWLKKDHLYHYPEPSGIQGNIVPWMILSDLNKHSLAYHRHSYSIRHYIHNTKISVYTILSEILFINIL